MSVSPTPGCVSSGLVVLGHPAGDLIPFGVVRVGVRAVEEEFVVRPGDAVTDCRWW